MRCALLSLALAAGCTNVQEIRLPTFDAAHALPMTPPEPAFFMAAQVPSDLPLATPYAQVAGSFHAGCDETEQAWDLLAQCCYSYELRPDFIVFTPRGLASSGTSLQVSPTLSSGGLYGFSVSSRTNVHVDAAVTCYRLAPVSLGLRTDPNWMVTHVGDGARSSGLQEGDSLQSIDGADMRPRTPQDVAPWCAAALGKKPGDAVEVVWIRPGTGRMRGMLTLGGPEPMPADAKPLPKPAYCWALRWR